MRGRGHGIWAQGKDKTRTNAWLLAAHDQVWVVLRHGWMHATLSNHTVEDAGLNYNVFRPSFGVAGRQR